MTETEKVVAELERMCEAPAYALRWPTLIRAAGLLRRQADEIAVLRGRQADEIAALRAQLTPPEEGATIMWLMPQIVRPVFHAEDDCEVEPEAVDAATVARIKRWNPAGP